MYEQNIMFQFLEKKEDLSIEAWDFSETSI